MYERPNQVEISDLDVKAPMGATLAERPRGTPCEEFAGAMHSMDSTCEYLRTLLTRITDGDIPRETKTPQEAIQMTVAGILNQGHCMIEERSERTRVLIRELECILFGGG